jgi:hypothetical protein
MRKTLPQQIPVHDGARCLLILELHSRLEVLFACYLFFMFMRYGCDQSTHLFQMPRQVSEVNNSTYENYKVFSKS